MNMLASLDLNTQIFAGDSHLRSQLPRATEALLMTTKHPQSASHAYMTCASLLKEPIGQGANRSWQVHCSCQVHKDQVQNTAGQDMVPMLIGVQTLRDHKASSGRV
jgi:hypothetical protein